MSGATTIAHVEPGKEVKTHHLVRPGAFVCESNQVVDQDISPPAQAGIRNNIDSACWRPRVLASSLSKALQRLGAFIAGSLSASAGHSSLYEARLGLELTP